jgi:membrane protease YdiL (CAAX protease family)
MYDPTELVLTGGFAASLVIFVLFAALRLTRGNRLAAPVVEGSESAVESAADSPVVVEVLPPSLPVGKVPVWFYGPLDLVGVACVFGVFGALVLSSAGASRDMVPDLKPATLLINIGFQFVMAGAVAVVVVKRVGWVAWLGLRWRGWPWVFVIAPCAVLIMWAVFGGLQECGYMDWMESLGVETVQDTVKLLQQSDDPLILGLMAVAAVIAAPLCEEVVFRGYFYPVMKRYAGLWPAAVCSALVFAAAHGNLTALLPLFVFGGLLVLIYEKTGSLWAPVAVHCCFNSATVIAQFAVRYYHLPLDNMP